MARSNLVFIVFLGALAALAPPVWRINPYYYDILVMAGINIILAVSLNLINGYTGQFSLGHAGFMAVGAYTSACLTLHAGGQGGLAGVAIFAGALLAGSLTAALAGLIVGIPSLRVRGDYLAIVTLGFNEIIKGVIQNAEPLGAQRGLGGMVQYTGVFSTFAGVALTVLVVHNLVNSTYGRGFPATHDDEIAAESIGLNTMSYKITAFVVGAFFAGLAGGLYAHFKQFIHPEGFNFMRSIDVVVMVIIGGMGSMVGVCLAAVLLTVLPEILRYVAHIESLPHWLQQIAGNRMILYSLLLVVLMLARPQGLFNFKIGKRMKLEN
ncbi:MAG: branched-chain amino acid ABC transporter permease [Verrucomicrobiota bacterium]|nr:branched-chain amino acid ABC transporter permease [Verrucomicrobiota bacterium]